MVTFSHDLPGTAATDWAAHPRSAELPILDLDADNADRLVVLTAHPDDESLGAGGLIARAYRSGLELIVVAATDGEASHPLSTTHTPGDLAAIRRTELRAAVDRLAPGVDIRALALPDGELAAHADDLVVSLVALIGDGRRTILVAPWRHDGHPDHEAAGRAAATAAARTGARLLEYPIWFWHWGRPEDGPWERLGVLSLDSAEEAAKADAQAAYRSQLVPLSSQSGDGTLLSADFLLHFSGRREIYVAEPPQDTALDDLHARDADPWGADSRWYEARKRSLLLSALPRLPFRRGLEIGSSTGALAADLAERCGDLVVIDASAQAVAAAQSRLGDLDSAQVERMTVPSEWPVPPTGGFDLIVLSEVGYFLSPRDLDGLIERIRVDLAPDGVLALCHWRHDIVGWPLDGPAVHETITAAGIRPVVAEYRDRDVEILVLATPAELPDPQASS